MTLAARPGYRWRKLASSSCVPQNGACGFCASVLRMHSALRYVCGGSRMVQLCCAEAVSYVYWQGASDWRRTYVLLTCCLVCFCVDVHVHVAVQAAF
jgi:hypothetical protein